DGYMRVSFLNSAPKDTVQFVDQEIYSGSFTPFFNGLSSDVSIPAESIPDGAADSRVIRNRAVSNSKLTDDYYYSGVIGSGTDLNTVTREGIYSVTGALNTPSDITSTSFLIVHNTNNSYIRQEIYDRFDVTKTFIRVIEPASGRFGEWVRQVNSNNVAGNLNSKSIVNAKLADTYNYNGALTGVSMG